MPESADTLVPQTPQATSQALAPLPGPLAEALPTFELFFKTFGFKRVHGRIWGLLVLTRDPLSSKDIAGSLSVSMGTVSTSLNELAEWGAVVSTFDPERGCHLHGPVGNALSIVATVFRRREQVVFEQFRLTTQRSLAYITEHHGERDPRVVTLRSILATCDIAEAIMQLVFGAVQGAMSDPESMLSKAITAAFKVGVGVPAKIFFPGSRSVGAIEVPADPEQHVLAGAPPQDG